MSSKKAAALAAMKATAASLTGKAFAASEGEGALVNAMRAACGSKPTVEQFTTFRRAIVVGAMASHLAQQGDNRKDTALFALCVDLLDNYQGATGTAPVKEGMKGRRTKEQEDAYTYARKVVQRICERAGVENPEKRGKAGASTKAANNAAAKKAAAEKVAKATAKEGNGKLAIRTFKKPEPFVEYALIAAKSLQSTYNKSAAACNASASRTAEAIAALYTAAIEDAKALGMNV